MVFGFRRSDKKWTKKGARVNQINITDLLDGNEDDKFFKEINNLELTSYRGKDNSYNSNNRAKR